MTRAFPTLKRYADDIEKEPVGAGTGTVKQVLISADEAPHFAMRRFIMEPGGGMPRHTNSVEHEQYILRGRAQIGVGDEILNVKQGDVVFIPGGLPHWYEVEGDEPFEFLCLVPNQPDELKILE